MPTNRKVIDFKIHNLTEEQFQELKEAGQIDPNAIYCTPDETVANFEAVNARIDETNKKLNTFESGVNETVGVINTTIANVDKKVDEAIQTEQQHNIEINARVDEIVADFEEAAEITSEQLNNKADVSDVEELQKSKLDKSAEIYLVPTGSVIAFAGITPPAGWLKCDGSAISRTTYAKLFAVIGTGYGAGDGSTTFNLPRQSVLPLGTQANIITRQDGTATTQAYRFLSNNQVAGNGLASIENGISYLSNQAGTEFYLDLGSSSYADLANATGATAIVCIKY